MESILSLEKGYLFIGVFFAVSLLVIMAIMLDLWDGVYTAKRTGRRVHSHKLRVTIAKVSEYWRFLLIGFLADCLGFLFSFYFLPFMALLFGMSLIVVEIISMIEHAKRRKSHLIDLPEIIDGIIAATSKKDAEKIIGVISTKSEVSPHH